MIMNLADATSVEKRITMLHNARRPPASSLQGLRQNETKPKRSGDMKCYNCHHRAHLARNCSSALYCGEQSGGGEGEEVAVSNPGSMGVVTRDVAGKGKSVQLGDSGGW